MPQRDLSGQFNTQLSPKQEAAFEAWAKAHKRERDVVDYDLRGAWLTNAREASNGHLPDTFKKPNHPTFSTESKYNGAGGAVGGEWVGDDKSGWTFKASPANLANMSAADLAAYFKRAEPDVKLVLPQPRRSDAEVFYPPKAAAAPAADAPGTAP